MNKGELMKTKYTIDELKNIDASLPLEIIKELLANGEEIYYYVMNYNNSVFGVLEDMREEK